MGKNDALGRPKCKIFASYAGDCFEGNSFEMTICRNLIKRIAMLRFKNIYLTRTAIIISACLVAIAPAVAQKDTHNTPKMAREWRSFVKEKPVEWFGSKEAEYIAHNILLYQRSCGGWPKNVRMSDSLSIPQEAAIEDEKELTQDATIDNGATTTELAFLARIYNVTKHPAYREAFAKGFKFLQEMQLSNGGWPQFYDRKGYYTHITYNDNAMVNVMILLKKVADRDALFEQITTESDSSIARKMFEKGVDCILKTQIVVDGTPTVWCAQHDEKTLKPAKARAYELPSFSGLESAEITKLLMNISNPSPEIIRAVKSAMAWFDRAKITGKKLEIFTNSEGKRDRRLVDDSLAAPIWARFYNLDDMRPFVCDRDGVKKYDFSEIGYERRTGYGWYGDWPQELYPKYEKWLRKLWKAKK